MRQIVVGEAPATAPEAGALVRLGMHLNSRVKVPDLADTAGPVTESNCVGAISPGGEQLEVNDQSVTIVNTIRPQMTASPRAKGRSPNKIAALGVEGVEATQVHLRVVGDTMVGSGECDYAQCDSCHFVK